MNGPLSLRGRARDLLTASDDGRARVTDEAAFEATVDYVGSRDLVALTTRPAVDGAERLIGVRAAPGFRAALRTVLPGGERSCLLQLLDDIPVATLIAGQSQLAEMSKPGASAPPIANVANLCAGWREDGTMVRGMAAGWPPDVVGPLCTSVADTADPLAWHEIPPASATMMRRHRRLDVNRDVPGGGWRVAAFLRDSHWPGSGPATGKETVLHEYSLHLDLSAAGVITSLDVTPHVLPWGECLPAAAAAGRLVGTPLAELDARVRADMVGLHSCTHLNDILRSLGAVPVLVRAEPGW